MLVKSKLIKVARDTDKYLQNFIRRQNKTFLLQPMKYGLFSKGKRIRSKILVDVGKIFNVDYKTLIALCSAVECIHSYSLIHDDLPCMDNDDIRRGKLSTHKKFGEATAVLAGNSLLTLAFEIITQDKLKIKNKNKNKLISYLSKYSGHTGIAGGQYLDLSFEHKKISNSQIIDMQIKKTGKLFSFCCIAPAIIKEKKKYVINDFIAIGFNIGLLFQVVDDLLDYKGNSKIVGKKTKKDLKSGKATLINFMGYYNSIEFAHNLKNKIISQLNKYGINSKNLIESVEFIIRRTS
tara:strand:+ start:204 stop:1082 length:879 start_codon:yes stop_codon:yes gene_type:complete